MTALHSAVTDSGFETLCGDFVRAHSETGPSLNRPVNRFDKQPVCLPARRDGKEGCPMGWFSDPRYLLSGAIIAPMVIMALVHYSEVMARWRRAQRANLAAAKFATEQTFVCVYERMDMSVLCHPADKMAPMSPFRDIDSDPAFLRAIEEAADRAIARYGLERIDLPREVGTF